jgi:hypothetical protein
MHTSTSSKTLLTLAISLFVPALGACGTPEEDVGQDSAELADAKIGLFFIDGTQNTIYSSTNISAMYRSVSADSSYLTSAMDGDMESTGTGSHITKTRYYAGPSAVCFNWFRNDCWDTALRMATHVCQGLRSGEFTGIAVFGYSRGAFMANQAIASARRACPEVFPEDNNPVLFEGFFDAVETNIWEMSDVVTNNTPWLHLHRFDTTKVQAGWPVLFNTAFFSGSNGANEPLASEPELDHGMFGYSLGAYWRMTEAANRAVPGRRLFPNYYPGGVKRP